MKTRIEIITRNTIHGKLKIFQIDDVWMPRVNPSWNKECVHNCPNFSKLNGFERFLGQVISLPLKTTERVWYHNAKSLSVYLEFSVVWRLVRCFIKNIVHWIGIRFFFVLIITGFTFLVGAFSRFIIFNIFFWRRFRGLSCLLIFRWLFSFCLLSVFLVWFGFFLFGI